MVRSVWQGLFVSEILLVLLLAACTKKEGFQSVLLLSHAGMGLDIQNSFYHDNSFESVETACSMIGCDGVEVDVQLSSDGELWLYHDETLDTETNGSGCIPERTSSYLSNITYKTIHKEKLCRLLSISDVQLFGKELFLDLRHLNFCSGTFVSIDKMISRLSQLSILKEKIWIVTNNKNWLLPLKDAGFKVVFQLDSQSNSFSDATLADGFIVRNTLISVDQVRSIQKAGKKLFIFELRSPRGIRAALRKQPDGILSDDIRAAIIEKN
jgi:glycerophosphoryl diester phosphodiesterase